MSKNHRLVEYFVSEFYLDKTAELAHIVSPKFIFKTPFVDQKNFDEYVIHVHSHVKNSNVTIDHISSKDDSIFEVEFTLETLENTANYGKKVSNIMKIKIEDNLVQQAEIGYDVDVHHDADQLKYIL